MKNRVIAFCLFSCIGITTEIFFTSFYGNIVSVMEGGCWDWSMPGKSYAWMFLIYGIASLFFPFAMDRMKNVPLIGRLLVYSLAIYIAEFLSGYILQQFTGSCPWEYKTGYHIMGLIRLDYLPAWMVFAYILEQMVVFFRGLGLIPGAVK